MILNQKKLISLCWVSLDMVGENLGEADRQISGWSYFRSRGYGIIKRVSSEAYTQVQKYYLGNKSDCPNEETNYLWGRPCKYILLLLFKWKQTNLSLLQVFKRGRNKDIDRTLCDHNNFARVLSWFLLTWIT